MGFIERIAARLPRAVTPEIGASVRAVDVGVLLPLGLPEPEASVELLAAADRLMEAHARGEKAGFSVRQVGRLDDLMVLAMSARENGCEAHGIAAVAGLDGNALFLLPNIRNGILLHTGEWPNWSAAADIFKKCS